MSRSDPPVAGRHALVIDDDRALRGLFTTLLGRNGFTVDVNTNHRYVSQKHCDRRRWDRQNAMLGFHSATRPGHSTGIDFADVKLLHSNEGANDVDNRVYCTDFMKMNFLDGKVMHRAFGLSQQRNSRDCAFLK